MATKQQIPRPVHQLHAVVGATTIGMVLSCATFPRLVHLGLAEPTGAGQMKALAGEDRFEIGMLAERPPVSLAERRTALGIRFALARLATRCATETHLLRGALARGLVAGGSTTADQQTG